MTPASSGEFIHHSGKTQRTGHERSEQSGDFTVKETSLGAGYVTETKLRWAAR